MKNIQAAGFATRAIHYGYDAQANDGALAPPLHLTSTFAFPNSAAGGLRFSGAEPGHVYSRISNPTTALLEKRLAALEGGEAAVVTASGMGAISASLWTLLRPGDQLLTDMTVYGCSFSFFHHGLAAFGVEIVHADLTNPEAAAAAITSKTRIIFLESPTNPNMRIIDLSEMARLARQARALLVVDNTYATPFLQRPLEHGADLVVHSATKYLSGHGDVIAGAAVGSEELISRIRLEGVKDFTGASLSPFDAFLVMRGLKTLALRVARHCESAQIVASRLEADPAVGAVLYPGLRQFPQHDLAARQMCGGFGGMVAFELNGENGAPHRFLDSLKMIQCAVSLGDAETLAQHPATMTHSTYSVKERAKHGIGENLLRLSVGLEDVEDIWSDISQALSAV